MRNVAAGIIIFFVVIFFGAIVFFGIVRSPNKEENFEYEGNEMVFSDSRHQYVFEYVEGVAQKNTEGDLGWVDVDEKQYESGNINIRTKSNSGLVLIFEEGLFLKLGSETEIRISFEGSDKMKIELVSGSVFSRLDGFDRLEYFLKAGEHEIFSKHNSFIAKKNNDLSIEIIVLEGDLSIGGDRNFSSNQKIDIVGGEISSRGVLMSDFESRFVSWSIGEGRVGEIRKQFEEKEKNETDNQDQDVDNENNLEQ